MNDPKTDPHAVQLSGGIRRALRDLGNGICQRAVAIGREQKDRFDVGRRRAHERQAIGLRPGVRPLVRSNAPWLIALRGDSGEHTASREPLAGRQREVLREHIQHRLRVAPQHAFAAPGGQSFGGDTVAVVFRTSGRRARRGRRGRRFRQHDVHDILCGECRVPRALGLIDHVVRRRDQRAEAVDGNIPLTLKGRDEVRHELS